jgi:hypothetical protein
MRSGFARSISPFSLGCPLELLRRPINRDRSRTKAPLIYQWQFNGATASHSLCCCGRDRRGACLCDAPRFTRILHFSRHNTIELLSIRRRPEINVTGRHRGQNSDGGCSTDRPGSFNGVGGLRRGSAARHMQISSGLLWLRPIRWRLLMQRSRSCGEPG